MFNRIRYIVLVLAIFVAGNSVTRAAQFARPDGTLSSGGWTVNIAIPHHEAVDDTSAPYDETDYIEDDATGGGADVEFSLSDVTDPASSTGHVVRFWFRSDGGGQGEKFDFTLVQGTTVIASSNNQQNGTGSYVVHTITLDATQADSITDYTDLRLRVSVAGVTGSDYARVTAMELEVPDAASATEPTVTSQPATSIDTTTATLWATITDDGGDTITARGTVWDTTSTPRANLLAEGGTVVESFSHGRTGLYEGTLIYFAGYATNNSALTGYSGDSSFYTEPGQASTVDFANVTDTEMRITWTVGTSDATYGATVNSIVIVKQGSLVTQAPADGNGGYSSGTSAYNDGTDLGGSEYVVYTGTGTQVDITGLTESTTYHVAVYAFVGSGSSTNYQQSSAPADSQATDAGVSAPTLISPTEANIDTDNADLGATVDTNGGSAIISRGTVWGTSSAPVTNLLAEGGTALDIPYSHNRTGLYEGTLIYYRGYASNSTLTGYSTDGTFYTEPLQASAIGFANVTDTAMRITWTAGTSDVTYGAAVNSIVIVKQSSVVTQAPADGNGSYSGGTSTYNDGTDLGGSEYVVFSGVGTQVDITDLTAEATYYVTVYAFVGSGGSTNYQQDGAPADSQQTNVVAVLATLSTPTATSIEAASAFLGATITDDGGGTIDERGTVWGTTSAPTTNAAPEGGTAVDEAYSHNRTGLTEGALIYYRGYADNSAGRAYSPAPGGSFYTEPLQASTVGFGSVAETSMTITWSAGTSNGGETVGSIVVVKQGGVVTQAPADGVDSYSGGTSAYNDGTNLGGSEYVVFNGVGTSVDITGLTVANTYYVAVYAYVASGASTNYQQTDPAADSQATTGGGPDKPTLSLPTVINADVDTTSATLGATVDSDGGETPTRGTVWDTSPVPTISDNVTVEGSGTGLFTHLVSPLPVGSLIYYRGYATNGAGTGYSPEDSFYTEPGQASAITFQYITGIYTGFTWADGTSDGAYGAPVGAIVIAKQGSAVTQAPVDGIEYYASARFGDGTDLGGGEYVVYIDPNEAQVLDLTANTTYHFAVYSYVGSGSKINYQQDSPAIANNTTGPPSHNVAHGITDCLTCHSMHTAFIPHDTEQVTTCIDRCHRAGGAAENKSAVALHTADSGATIVDCGSCHDVHAYDFETTDTAHGGGTATNLSRIRWDTDKYMGGWEFDIALEPAIFQQRPAHFAYDETAYPSGPFNGICQTCHTRVNKHTNDGWDDDAGAAADNDHEKGSDCMGCHAHEDSFAGTGGSCTSCHDKIQDDDTEDGVPARRAVVDEFGYTSHHVVGGPVTDDDCGVCHMEAITHDKNGLIDLRNPDTGGAIPGFVQFTRAADNDFSDEPWVTNVQNLLCLKCHDSGGAEDPCVPVAGGSAMQPFSSNSRNVPNTYDQFDPANDFYHPVRAAGTNPFCTQTTTNGSNITMKSPWNQGADDHDLISCFDCHMTSGHGGANQRMLKADNIDFDDMMLGNLVTTTMGYPIRTLCFTCHDQAVYLDTKTPENIGSGFSEHGGAISNHRLDNNVLSCMGCHAGPYNQGGSTVPSGNGAAPGIIHGGSYTWSEGYASGNDADFFVLGGYISGFYTTGTASGDCGGGNCSHPSGKSY